MEQIWPTMLIPGLAAGPRLYSDQIPALWRLGPVSVAQHFLDDSITVIARRILVSAPPRFSLVGPSMGGYIAFEILRQAPERVARLALLDTTARPDTPEQTRTRREQIALAQTGRMDEIIDALMPRLVHPMRAADTQLRAVLLQMAREVGAEGIVRQQQAVLARQDSRPTLKEIRCPTLVLVGEQDAVTPPEWAAEIADGIPGAHRVVVPDCGHLSTLEQPEAVTSALLQFLAP